MMKSSVRLIPYKNQSEIYIKDDISMLRSAFHSFLDNIILENATRNSDYWSLGSKDIPYHDKKIFLSYLTTPDDFEYFTASPIRERLALEEYEKEMQYLIDERIDDVYHEYNYEISRR